MEMPEESMGIRIIDCRLWTIADGSVWPIKMHILHLGSPAPDVHHLRPLMTYSSPRRSIRERIFVASEEATSGSVIAKQERISPAKSGFSQRSRCSGVPYRASTSMFPVSGAEQLNTSGANLDRPIVSHGGAYSKFVSPAPCSESGRNRFHSPADLALAFSSSRICGGCQRSRLCNCSA